MSFSVSSQPIHPSVTDTPYFMFSERFGDLHLNDFEHDTVYFKETALNCLITSLKTFPAFVVFVGITMRTTNHDWPLFCRPPSLIFSQQAFTCSPL